MGLTAINPVVKIVLEGQPILIPNDRLISCRLTDQAGMESDNVCIKLDQRDWKIARPSKGVKLDIFMGYRETGIKHMGKFAVDETTLDFMPKTLTINAKAAAMQGGLKNQRKQSYHQKKLGEIVETIASRNGLSPALSEELKNKEIPHIDQFNESDLHFLTRLSKRYGAIFTVKNDKLLFIYRGEGKTASGLDLPVIKLAYSDIASGSHKSGDRGKYDEVIAEYHDLGKAKRMQVSAKAESEMSGAAEAKHQIRTLFASEAEAKDAADACLKSSLMNDGELDISMVGRNDIMAETPLQLVGGWPPELEDSLWVVDRVDHDITGKYVINFTAKTPWSYAKELRGKLKQAKENQNNNNNGQNSSTSNTTGAANSTSTGSATKKSNFGDFSQGYKHSNTKGY